MGVIRLAKEILYQALQKGLRWCLSFVDPTLTVRRSAAPPRIQIGFKRISEAYSVLRDPEKRAECPGAPGAPGAPGDEVSEPPLLVIDGGFRKHGIPQ